MHMLMKLNTIWKTTRDLKRARDSFAKRTVTKISQRKSKLLLPTVNYSLVVLDSAVCDNVFVYFYNNAYSVLFSFNKAALLGFRMYNCDIFEISFLRRIRGNQDAYAYLLKYLHIFFVMFFVRLRMRGRLYRIYNRNIYRDLQYRLGRAHMVTVYVDGFFVKFLRKRFFRVAGYDFLALPLKADEAKKTYPQNIYTRRGVCIGGQEVRTRIGKAVK